jgi:hypothetical protein
VFASLVERRDGRFMSTGAGNIFVRSADGVMIALRCA